MKASIKILLAAVGFAFSLGMAAQQQKHTVQQGETVYGIARKYGLTVNDIVRANPNIGNGDRITVGQALIIPQKAQPTTQPVQTAQPQTQQTTPANSNVQTHQEPAAYTIDLPKRDDNKVQQQTTTTTTHPIQQGGFLNSGCKEMYQVKKKDNLYRIALQYNLTIEELCAANPELKPDTKIKKGSWLCIPFSRAEIQAEADRVAQEQAKAKADREAVEKAIAAATKSTSKKHLNVAVILPLKAGGDKGMKMVEFYRGLLMAADSVKQQGTSIDIYAYHSGTTASDVKVILAHPEMKTMDLVFGPLESAQASALNDFCMQNKIRLVTPFSTTNTYGQNNPYTYQASINSEAARKNAVNKVTGYFTNHNYVILSTGMGDDRGTKFTNDLRSRLTALGQNVQTLDMNSDDATFATVLNQFRDNLIIPDASSLSATTALTKKLQAFKQNNPIYKITLLGYPEWPTYAGNLLSSFNNLDTYAYSTFYRNPNDYRVTAFEAKFKKNFAREIAVSYPRYGIYGFDLGYYFMNGVSKLGDYFDEKYPTLRYNAFQNGFSFEQSNESAAHINQQIILVHYSNGQRVEVIK